MKKFIVPCLLLALVGYGLVWQAYSEPPSSSPKQSEFSYFVFLPLVAKSRPCQPIPGASYEVIPVPGPHPSIPASQHPDLNLAVRGYIVNPNAYLGLVDYGGGSDPAAPQLYGLFSDERVPEFVRGYRVYDWDWDNNRRGEPITTWDVTLLGMRTTPGELIYLPYFGLDIYQGRFHALVLYAEETRLTLVNMRQDTVAYGYALHLEDICVDPNLVALYREWDARGRDYLPALSNRQPFATASGNEIKVAVRDTGSFMDPRSRKDWWQGK